MPELPIPCANGQLEPAQGGSSISSFVPAATTLGLLGSMATDGSCCLFCGHGVAGLPLVTIDSVAACTAAGAAKTSAKPIAPAIHPRFSIPRTSSSPISSPGWGCGTHDVRSETDALDKPRRNRTPSRSGLTPRERKEPMRPKRIQDPQLVLTFG